MDVCLREPYVLIECGSGIRQVVWRNGNRRKKPAGRVRRETK